MPYFLQRLPCFVSTLLFATVCLAQPLPPSELSLEQIPEPIRYNISAADWQLFQTQPEPFRSNPP